MNETVLILIVDDDDAGRFVKSQTLRRAGFQVIEAATGTEALSLVASREPPVVLLDVNLPDISGLEVTRRLRAIDTVKLQILQISNTAVEPADRVKGLEQGADMYLVEPVPPEVLVATVRALLRVRRAESALTAALESERHARALAEEASRLKDEFLATLSHELRTPLNALLGWVWQLRHTKVTDQTRERALDSIERNARVQAQLINDLLDVSRVSKGKLQLEMRLVDLKQIVVTVCESISEPVEEKALELHVDLASVCVAGDQGRLQQIVTNLLTNAVQFTPAQGHVFVTLKAERDEVVLVVRDTGSGIDAPLLPYIFDPFRQGEGGLSRKHHGLGLGLAVVRQLVDLHGGSITVTSEGQQKGAMFTIRLPREEMPPESLNLSDNRLLLTGVRVRLDDGEEADRGALQVALESSGAEVRRGQGSVDGGSSSDVDVVAQLGKKDGRMTLRLASAPTGADAASLPASALAAEVVRSIARLTAKKPA